MASAEFVASIVSLLVFYILIVAIGVLSSIWFRRKYKTDSSDFDLQIVAGRKLGPVVGFLSMSGIVQCNLMIILKSGSPHHTFIRSMYFSFYD